MPKLLEALGIVIGGLFITLGLVMAHEQWRTMFDTIIFGILCVAGVVGATLVVYQVILK